MKKYYLFFTFSILVNLIFAQPAACDSLKSGINPSTGSHGNMFDIHVINKITIQTFSMAIKDGTSNVNIYHRQGTMVGHDAASADWTLLDSATVTGVSGTLTKIPLNLNLVLNANSDHAFYITVTKQSAANEYSTGTSIGTMSASDANIQVKEGRAGWFPFNMVYFPRIFNGQVYYCLGGNGINPESVLHSLLIDPLRQEIKVICETAISKLQVMDISGKTILETNSTSLDYSLLTPGIYCVYFEYKEGSIKRMLIKN
jgi:hypothetical protein